MNYDDKKSMKWLILLVLISCGKESGESSAPQAKAVYNETAAPEIVVYPTCKNRDACDLTCKQNTTFSAAYNDCMSKVHYPGDREVCSSKFLGAINNCRRDACEVACEDPIRMQLPPEKIGECVSACLYN